SWVLENQQVKSGSHRIDKGVGVRVNEGEKTGFAYTDVLQKDSISIAVKTARSIARSQADVSSGINLRAQNAPQLYTAKDVLSGVDNQTVIDLLMRMDKQARKQDPRVKKVVCSLVSSQEEIMVAATDGIFATDIRPMVKLSIQVICVDDKGRMEMGYAGGGGRILVSEDFAPGFADIFVADAVRGALINLQAKPAPRSEERRVGRSDSKRGRGR